MTVSPIRVLLVEDHAYVREALALALARESDLAVVGQAGSLVEARGRLANVDVAVVDLDLPNGDGAALIAELHAVSPRASALALTASARRGDVARAVEAGATCVLHKSVPLAAIVEAVRRHEAGELLLAPEEQLELLRLASQERRQEEAARRALARLTPRERGMLELLGEGLSEKEIAQRLCLSPETVHSHMVNLLRKLGVTSRLQALIFAVRHGVVSIE